jgi:hypothetical protein
MVTGWIEYLYWSVVIASLIRDNGGMIKTHVLIMAHVDHYNYNLTGAKRRE